MTTLSQLTELIEEKSEILANKVGERNALQRKLHSVEQEVLDLDKGISTAEKAMWLLQQYGETQQKVITSHIENIVTKGLQAVFQNPSLEFRLIYSETKKGEKKKLPEVRMALFYDYNGERQEGNLRSSFGGGISVVASVLLRIAVAMHLTHRVRPIIVLDEPLKDLSPNQGSGNDTVDSYRMRMAEFLRKLVDETDVQLIVVSHEDEYAEMADVHHKFIGGIGEYTKVKTFYPESMEELMEVE